MTSNAVRGYIKPHPFHLVQASPWPLYTSFSLMNLALSIGLSSHNYMPTGLGIYLSIVCVLSSMSFWFKDIIAEATYLGEHTNAVKRGLHQGFLLFVLSEILIFASLFWAYLHSAVNPTMDIGMTWPPKGISIISPAELPLLNTIILLASGVTITYGHHALINENRQEALRGFIASTILIALFVILQLVEYTYAGFTISDGVYGSAFFSLTGLHGLHMIMLTIMLVLCSKRVYNYDFTSTSHVFGEATILYLHVLDIIWLFIYILVYWWGS